MESSSNIEIEQAFDIGKSNILISDQDGTDSYNHMDMNEPTQFYDLIVVEEESVPPELTQRSTEDYEKTQNSFDQDVDDEL